MKIVKLHLIPTVLKLKQPFVSGHEILNQRELTIVELKDETGLYGFGELEAFSRPFYTSETQVTARWIIEHVLADLIIDVEFDKPQELYDKLNVVKDNRLAKAAVDSAVWDLYAKQQQSPLADVLAVEAHTSRQARVQVGISIGISDKKTTFASLNQALHRKYGRIKLKIQGNDDLKRVVRVRQKFPDTPLCVDANGSLIHTMSLAQEIDDLKLTMLEDPFSIAAHDQAAQLQEQMQTPLCYDEPISTVSNALQAIKNKECQIISMKSSVLGGLTPSLAMISAHKKYHFPLWCGGMVEGGVGRATNLALASLDEFAFPGDISETARFYSADYTTPEFYLRSGTLTVPQQEGIGVNICPEISGVNSSG